MRQRVFRSELLLLLLAVPLGGFGNFNRSVDLFANVPGRGRRMMHYCEDDVTRPILEVNNLLDNTGSVTPRLRLSILRREPEIRSEERRVGKECRFGWS